MYMTQTLHGIWSRRKRLLQNKTWKGDDPRCGFDFTNGILPHLPYTRNNWNDLTIQDFRKLLRNHYYENNPAPETGTPYHIATTIIDDQFYAVITIPNIGVFSVSWYKDRGGLDSFLNLEYGKPVTLAELTDILVAVGLEQPYETEKS